MKKQLVLSIVITLTFLSIGFLLLHYKLIEYGIAFFIILPFILGFVFGRNTFRRNSLIGLVVALVSFFLLLLAGGLEGMVCILMTLPLVIVGVAFGALVKYLLQKFQGTDDNEDLVKSSVLPLVFFLGIGFLEKQLTGDNKEVIAVRTEIVLPYSTFAVYDAIKSVDTLIAEKPFLMRLDLPIPNKCILEKEEVGGLRICYFTGGTITEKITELERGKVLKMDVIDYQLTGRKWLGFKEAIYYFEPVGQDSCKLTRITTYTSVLAPRFYWRPLEKTGISQEHEYVFDNLKRDLRIKQP